MMRYLGWQAEWWKQRVAPRAGLDREIEAGICAYALKQAAWHTRLAAFFLTKWNTSTLTPSREADKAAASDDEEPQPGPATLGQPSGP